MAPALEPAQVLQLCLGALSHDQATQKQAELALSALEAQPGYVSCLAVGLIDLTARRSLAWAM